MSNWGFSNFENESAGNFISDIETNGYGMIQIAIERIIDEAEAPNIIECEEALIAAELVAAAIKQPAEDLPENAADWVADNLAEGTQEQQEVAALTDQAAEAIDKIVTDSELKILWEETTFFDQWFQAQQELQNRLLGN
ncbi:MAG: DUF4259 domain-containing protein [Bacteroidota bacterium]|nr:DUF4259 domain-containing protein [Bacteroidota bacterium]